MRFETSYDLMREQEAIELFCKTFSLRFHKIADDNDIDFEIYKGDKFVCFAEVKGRNMELRYAFDLPISAAKLVKLHKKRKKSIIIWSCLDGIIVGKTKELIGTFRNGGRTKTARKGAVNDIEPMVYFGAFDNSFKIIKFRN